MRGKPLTVELVYDHDCPNIERARTVIRAALQEVGADPTWTEWEREATDTPHDRRGFASPTVLVNGREVGCDETDTVVAGANACRVYVDANGRACGAPSSRLIVQAIIAGQSHE